jgi:hypothetical protein
MAVLLNVMEPTKVLILEKSGLVWIVSTAGDFNPITSLSNSHPQQDPSVDADWSATNPSHVVTSLGGRILHWNLNQVSFPEEMIQVAGETIQKVQFHPTLDNYLAVLGTPGPVVSVMQSTGPTLLTDPLMVCVLYFLIPTTHFNNWNLHLGCIGSNLALPPSFAGCC